jgi:DNA-binding transcriptional LysR family regulator
MDKLGAMRTFIEIAEKGSLTRAAEALDTSLPTVVRTLAGLEAALGVRLMNRTTRRLSLTEEGSHYLARCKGILHEIDDAEAELTERQRHPQGVLRLTAPYRFGQMHVAPCAVAFAKRNPKIQIDLLLVDRLVNLIEEGIDVAVRIGHLADSSLTAVQVGQVRQVVCASPEYLEHHGTPAHPDDLAQHECVRVTGLTPSADWSFVVQGKTRLVTVRSPFICNQAAAAVDACASGLGIGMFLSYQVKPLLLAKALRRVLVEYELPAMPVSLVLPHGKLLPARARAFLNWANPHLREALAE